MFQDSKQKNWYPWNKMRRKSMYCKAEKEHGLTLWEECELEELLETVNLVLYH